MTDQLEAKYWLSFSAEWCDKNGKRKDRKKTAPLDIDIFEYNKNTGDDILLLTTNINDILQTSMELCEEDSSFHTGLKLIGESMIEFGNELLKSAKKGKIKAKEMKEKRRNRKKFYSC